APSAASGLETLARSKTRVGSPWVCRVLSASDTPRACAASRSTGITGGVSVSTLPNMAHGRRRAHGGSAAGGGPTVGTRRTAARSSVRHPPHTPTARPRPSPPLHDSHPASPPRDPGISLLTRYDLG